MSLPTDDPVPRIPNQEQLLPWATRLVDYLEKNIREWIMRPQRLSLANGDNNNIDVRSGLQIQLTGPTGAFAITGIGGGSPGRTIILINDTIQTMTIRNNNAGSQTQNRILTFTGDTAASIALLTYDNFTLIWKVVALR